MKVKVTQSCLTLVTPMNCSRLASSVHGIYQVRILERVGDMEIGGSGEISEEGLELIGSKTGFGQSPEQ